MSTRVTHSGFRGWTYLVEHQDDSLAGVSLHDHLLECLATASLGIRARLEFVRFAGLRLRLGLGLRLRVCGVGVKGRGRGAGGQTSGSLASSTTRSTSAIWMTCRSSVT